MGAKVVTFGEIMMRLSPPGAARFSQVTHLEMTFGGAEANVAVCLANFGIEAAFVTRLPDNDIAARAIAELRGLGVDVSQIVRGGQRMGIYFVEAGAGQRSSRVTYDRAHSAMAEITPGEIDWTGIFKGARWFHWTGITPALSENAAAVLREACLAAREAGVTISADMNYREKLWDRDQAQQVMSGFTEFIDVCIANGEHAEVFFGSKGARSKGVVYDQETSAEIAADLKKRFGFQQVALTIRRPNSTSQSGWSALLLGDGEPCFSKSYELATVERLGGGDSFAAGLIFTLLRGDNSQSAIEWAAAAAALKYTIPGDYHRVTVDEVNELLAGAGVGRVQR